MKSNNKYFLILVLILGIMFIPFNVMAEEGDEVVEPPTNTENNEPVDPGDSNTTPEEEITPPPTEPIIPTPDDNPSNESDKQETPENTDKEENKETEKEESKKEEEKEESKKEEEKEDKKPTNNHSSYNPSTTVVDNATKRVEISIINSKDKSLLSGIKFRIQDKKGNIFYEEETTDEIFVFEEMELGTYYLVQVNTLDGYEESHDKVKFVVSKDSEVVKVEVKNKLKEKPKKELKKPEIFTGTALLSTVAMFDVALGIGIFVYVRKAKKKIKNKK